MLKMIECVYQNDTSRMVIVKCIGADHFYREKVVMPHRGVLVRSARRCALGNLEDVNDRADAARACRRERLRH